jgi:hypothetical protein
MSMSQPLPCSNCGKPSEDTVCPDCFLLINPSLGTVGSITIHSTEPDGPPFKMVEGDVKVLWGDGPFPPFVDMPCPIEVPLEIKCKGTPLAGLMPYQLEQLFEGFDSLKTSIWRRELRDGNAAG